MYNISVIWIVLQVVPQHLRVHLIYAPSHYFEHDLVSWDEFANGSMFLQIVNFLVNELFRLRLQSGNAQIVFIEAFFDFLKVKWEWIHHCDFLKTVYLVTLEVFQICVCLYLLQKLSVYGIGLRADI